MNLRALTNDRIIHLIELRVAALDRTTDASEAIELVALLHAYRSELARRLADVLRPELQPS